MSFLSSSDAGKTWLLNFDETDRPLASKLLDSLLLVGASEFSATMIRLLTALANKAREAKECIALYAEREVASVEGKFSPSFPAVRQGGPVGLASPRSSSRLRNKTWGARASSPL